MFSSVPMEHSSEKYDQKSPYSDTKRKPSVSSKSMKGTAEISSQTKCSRMKQKRPDMPLYVPRARRLQEESEAQCVSRHTSPGRQKGKRSSAHPLEAQSKRLPKSTMINIDKVDPPHNSNSGCKDLISVVDKALEKNTSPMVLEKPLPQGKSYSVIEQHVNDGVEDLKSTCAMSGSSLLGRDCCFLSGDSNIMASTRSVPQLGEISNNSIVKPNSKSTVEAELKNSDFSDIETLAGNVAVCNNSVPIISNAKAVSLNSVEANSQNVDELSTESSVPFSGDDVNNECLSSVHDSKSQLTVSDQADVSTCPEERMLSESVSKSTSVETGGLVDQNLDKPSDDSTSQCSFSTSVSDDKIDSGGFLYGMDTSSSAVTSPSMEIIISEKNTVIENLSGGANCVQIITSEKISCFTSSKDEHSHKDESDKSELLSQSGMDNTLVEEVDNSSTTCCHYVTKIDESSNACVSNTDLPDVPLNVETPSESCISSCSVPSEVSAPSKTGSDGLKSSKAVDVHVERVGVCSKAFSDNGDSALEVESWDSMFDDDGECLNPEVLRELISAVGSVEIKTSKKDYTEYKPLESTVDEEFGNIIEIYGFPVEFQTQDLVSAFSCFKTKDFTIKWVDDCHALGVFSGAFAASEALTLQHPYVKVRPLSQGIRESKLKAKRCAEHLLPCKPRPATSATLARRLVTGALGLKLNVSREQRETERLAIKQARDRKRQVAKQRQDIWNGIVS